MNIRTPIAVQISCWRAPLSGGSLIKSMRWIMTRPRPLSKITHGRITGSAYGIRHRTAMCASAASKMQMPAT